MARIDAPDGRRDPDVEGIELRLRAARDEGEGLVHDLVARDAARAPEAFRDRDRSRGEAVLDAAVIGEELPEGRDRGRGQAAGGQVVQRAAEVGVAARTEQEIEDPARGAILADLLRERVLMEIDEDQDALPAAHRHDGRDAVEVAAVEPSRLGLERAPVDGQAQEVEAEGGHACGVAGVEDRDVLERRTAVGKGHVEDAPSPGVHAAEGDLTALLFTRAAVDDGAPPAVERGAGVDGDEEEHQEHGDMAAHLGVLYRARRSLAMPAVAAGCFASEWRVNPNRFPRNAFPKETSPMRKMREAVIVATARTGLAKSFRGSFNKTRPDDMAAHCIKALLPKVQQPDPEDNDVVV